MKVKKIQAAEYINDRKTTSSKVWFGVLEFVKNAQKEDLPRSKKRLNQENPVYYMQSRLCNMVCNILFGYAPIFEKQRRKKIQPVGRVD